MASASPQPLRLDDLVRLDRFLQSATCGGEPVSVSFAHGFLTAVASGPARLEPTEWLGLMFDKPVFETGEDAKEMQALAMRLHADIERGLRGETTFAPVFDYVRSHDGGDHADAQPWCSGFVAGFKLFGDRWPGDARDALRAPLGLIFSMAETPGAGDPLYAQICESLPGAAELMFQFWRTEGRP